MYCVSCKQIRITPECSGQVYARNRGLFIFCLLMLLNRCRATRHDWNEFSDSRAHLECRNFQPASRSIWTFRMCFHVQLSTELLDISRMESTVHAVDGVQT